VREFEYHSESPDNYLYDGACILINKFGIRDSDTLLDVERRFTAGRLIELSITPIRGLFDFAHLKKIHAYIFQDLFDWAGKPRQAGFLSKSKTVFRRGEYIDSQAMELFSKLKFEKFSRELDKTQFIERLSYFMGEVNASHPFREGNGRTSREFFRELSLNAGYDLDWGNADKGWLLAADIRAFRQHYAPLITILERTVQTGDKS
jgi:cell filamentation protein